MKQQIDKKSSSKPTKKFKVKKIKTMPDEPSNSGNRMFYIPTNFMTKNSWLRTTADFRNSRSGNSSRSMLKENKTANINSCFTGPGAQKLVQRVKPENHQTTDYSKTRDIKASVFSEDKTLALGQKSSNLRAKGEQNRLSHILTNEKAKLSLAKDMSKSSTKENLARRQGMKILSKPKSKTNRSQASPSRYDVTRC